MPGFNKRKYFDDRGRAGSKVPEDYGGIDPGEPPPTPVFEEEAPVTVVNTPGAAPNIWGGGNKATRASPGDLADAAPTPREQFISISAENAILPLAFGDNLLPSRWGVIHDTGAAYTFLLLIWCRGPANAFLNVYADQQIIGVENRDIAIVNYLGATPGTVDPWLAAAIGSPTYADTLDGICHSVVRLNSNRTPNIPRFTAAIETLKLFDPRTSSTVYSRNPALMYRYAATLAGFAVNDNDIEETADACDGAIGGKKRRECGIYFDRPLSVNEILQTLAEYAGAFHYMDGNTARLIPDRPRAVSMSFTWDEADPARNKIVEGTFRVRKKSRRLSPNYVLVTWTDKTVFPWRTRIAYPPALPTGRVISTRFDMQGIQSYAEANRQRIERTNRYNLTDLEIEFVGFDESQELEVGDVFDINSDDMAGKRFRAIKVGSTREPGQVYVAGEEYDEASYSNSVVSEPTYPDTNLPDPSAIPVGPTPTELLEILWTDNAGKTFTVFRIKWLGSSWSWARGYRVRAFSPVEVIFDQVIPHDGSGEIHEIRTAPSIQGVEYTVTLEILNPDGVKGPPSTSTVTGAGNLIPPSNVAQNSLVGYEFGFFVRIKHAPALDSDLAGYRYKRLSASLWEAAATDAARWNHASVVTLKHLHGSPGDLFEGEPVGTYYYGVRAVDDWGNESAESAWVKVTVTDANAGQLATKEVAHILIPGSNMYERFEHGAKIGGWTFITHEDDGFGFPNETFATLFGTEATPFPATQNVNWNYFSPVSNSSIRTASWDTGSDRTGEWSVYPANVTALDGATITETVYLKKTVGSYTQYANGTELLARYVYGHIASSKAMAITVPMTLSFQGKPKEETQTINIPASPQPHTITFTSGFAQIPDWSFVLLSDEPVTIGFDNESSSAVDVRAWAAAGHSTATPGDPVAATIKINVWGV